MITANEAIIVRAYEAFHAGDMDAIKNECFSQDIEWTWPGTGPLSGVYNDINAVLGMFGKLFTDSEGTFKDTPDSISGFGDFVVVRSRASWKGRHGSYDDPYIQVFRIENGRASECSIHLNDMKIWDQFPA